MLKTNPVVVCLQLCLVSILINKALCCDSSNKENQCIRTSYGTLQGKLMTSRNGRIFSAFLGVPYAAPPLGKLRFSTPIPPEPWTGVRNATEESEACLQRHQIGSEDCLYLNIFTHSTSINSRNLTVMVYIHGGGFYIGSSSTSYLGPEYLMDRDIVLVTLQYRLGPFGFLSTEDETLPGNWGLKDQVRALQWVKENIQFFGGDPEKVTIFGNSAGGASVHFLMKSSLSKDLFVKAISQSGIALSTFATLGKGKAKNDAERLAFRLNCSVETSLEILLCLQSKSSLEILAVYEEQLKSNNEINVNKIFRPVLEVENENAFITEKSIKAKTEKPWLVGVNANEGIFKIQTKHLSKTIELINTDFNNFATHLMYINDLYTNVDQIANMTKEFYFKNVSTTNDVVKSVEQMVTDSWFVWPTEQALRQHNGPVYYYLYDHQAEHTYAQMNGCPNCRGVSHTDELIVLFKNKKIPELNEEDGKISRLMVDLWVNFATRGNPTPNPIWNHPLGNSTFNDKFTFWKQSNNSDPSFLYINFYKLSMEQHIFPERMRFWTNLQLTPVL